MIDLREAIERLNAVNITAFYFFDVESDITDLSDSEAFETVRRDDGAIEKFVPVDDWRGEVVVGAADNADFLRQMGAPDFAELYDNFRTILEELVALGVIDDYDLGDVTVKQIKAETRIAHAIDLTDLYYALARMGSIQDLAYDADQDRFLRCTLVEGPTAIDDTYVRSLLPEEPPEDGAHVAIAASGRVEIAGVADEQALYWTVAGLVGHLKGPLEKCTA